MLGTEQGVGARWRRRGAYVLGVTSDITGNAARKLRTGGSGENLAGDRWVEWSFCFARMAEGPGRSLDVGADIGFLTLAAAQRGHHVVAFDRLPDRLDYAHPNVSYLQADILTHDFGDERFDQIINCSSIEHVGLSGRYGSTDASDGDLEAMGRLRDLLAPQGRMILTVPIGRDGVFTPQHRIYGAERLPKLLDGFRTLEEQYWVKEDGRWRGGDRTTALAVQGSAAFYALGLFVLTSP